LGVTHSLRLGVFGGAFDPPHNAHVALAQAAVEQLQLDQLRILPTGNAWHRVQDPAAAEHRLAMARIAFGELLHTLIDDRELRRAGPSYTIDTLRELRTEHPDGQLFLVLGEDQALTITRWHEWEAVLQLATLCVAARPDARAHANLVPAGVPARARVQTLRLPSTPESATEVRARLAQHQPISHLVPPGVASYIERHYLYQNQEH
jgi:nicotinate-nucleotide adenylyltransferase